MKKTKMSKKGQIPWNKGLKSSTDDRVKKQADSIRGHSVSEQTRKKISLNNGTRRKEVKIKMSESHKGKVLPLSQRKKQSDALKGSKSYLWKGGITPIYHQIRTSFEYRLWREAVFKRDNFTCIWCGDNRGGNLRADHIKPFAYYPELRFALDNGRTLCDSCHRTTETFGNRIRFKKNAKD